MKAAVLFILLAAACVAFGEGDAVFSRHMERVATMDPLRAATVCDAHAVSLAYEALLTIDYEARPYRLRAGFCQLPDVSADGLTYAFRTVGGRTFADGTPATARDAAYSLRRLGDRANASSGMWIMDPVASVDAPDERTLRVTLKKPLHVFPWFMAQPYTAVLSSNSVATLGARFGGSANGTGPYRLVEWRRNHRMIFRRRPEWPGWDEELRIRPGRPFDEIRYLVIDDVSTQWLMFLSGELDFLGGVSRDNWDAVVMKDGTLAPSLAAKGVTLHAAPSLSTFYLGFNMRDPLLGTNRKLRQALNCAFNFPAWRRFYNGRVTAATTPVPPGVDGRLERAFPYAWDLEKAKRLLAEAGFPNGVDPKTGRRLKLEVALGRATQDAREMVELVQAFYARVGIDLETRFMTWDAYLKAVNDGRTQIFNLGWVGDYPDAENFLQTLHSRNASPGANHACYSSAAYDAAYDEAMAAPTRESRNAAWRRAQAILQEDCPWVFLHYPKTYSLVAPRLGGYKPSDFAYGTEKHLRRLP